MPTRNLFYDLPEELQQVIYEFDPTYRMVMKECLEEIVMNYRMKKPFILQQSSLYGRCLMNPNRLLNPNRILITEQS